MSRGKVPVNDAQLTENVSVNDLALNNLTYILQTVKNYRDCTVIIELKRLKNRIVIFFYFE